MPLPRPLALQFLLGLLVPLSIALSSCGVPTAKTIPPLSTPTALPATTTALPAVATTISQRPTVVSRGRNAEQLEDRDPVHVSAPPTAVDGTLYVGTNDGHVLALDQRTGQSLWEWSFGHAISSAPVVVDGTLYVGAGTYHPMQRNRVYALEIQTKQIRWSVEICDPVWGRPVVDEGIVYFTGGCTGVRAVDAQTGQQIWRIRLHANLGTTPAIAAKEVYYTYGSALVAADRSTGLELWRFPTGDTVYGSPTITADTVYIGSHDHDLYAVDRHTGQERWRFRADDGIAMTPTVAGDAIFVISLNGYLFALDQQTGVERWHTNLLSHLPVPTHVRDDQTGASEPRQQASIPARPRTILAANGLLFIGGGSEQVLALEQSTGALRWTYNTNTLQTDSFALAGDTIYVGTMHGRLLALDAAKGEERWVR